MSRLDEIFDNTISDYNENTSDINKFSFSKREKDIFKGMIRRYSAECCQASLEKAGVNEHLQGQMMLIGNGLDGRVYESIENIIKNPENIILL